MLILLQLFLSPRSCSLLCIPISFDGLRVDVAKVVTVELYIKSVTMVNLDAETRNVALLLKY